MRPRRNTPRARAEQELDRLFQEFVTRRDGWRCRLCGRRDRPVCAHHIIHKTQGDAVRWDPRNGATVCVEPCHVDCHASPTADQCQRTLVWKMKPRTWHALQLLRQEPAHYTMDDLREIRATLIGEREEREERT
jgi:hypothetical protein